MQVTLRICAKVNISLDVTGRREDGYHTLDSVLQPVGLFDTMTVSLKAGQGIRVLCDKGPDNEDNLCYRAAADFLERTGLSAKVTVDLHKGIPMTAGMGGGSADAAGVLLALNRLCANPLSHEALCELGLNLGADVPYFLLGCTARVQGIGELVEPVRPMPPCWFVLVRGGQKPSTGHMYALLDERMKHKDKQPATQAVVEALNNDDLDALCENLSNDFLAVYPDRRASAFLHEQGAKAVCLTGSGPIFYGIFDHKEQAESAKTAIGQAGFEVYLAQTEEKAIVFE